MAKTLLYNGIKWLLMRDDGHDRLYRHPTDPNRRLSVVDPTYTFQPSDINQYVSLASPDLNPGSNTWIIVLAGLDGYVYRTFLKFDLTGQIVVNSIINSATLSLYYYNNAGQDPVGRTYWAYRLTQTAWTELGVTWNKYDGTNAWATAGGDYTTTNGASAVMPASYGWVAWTVTAQVQTAVDSVGRIVHFLVRDGAETGAAIKRGYFYSRTYADTSLRPKLYVDWSLPVTYVNVSELGAGSEAAKIGLSVADSGVGAESGVAIGPLGTDAGVSAEAVTTSATMTVTDPGAGAESPAVQASVPSSDLGVGAETSVGIQNQLTETDAGVGSEVPSTSATLTVAESGAGAEAPGIAASIPISDSAVVSEVVTPSPQITIADSGALLSETVTTPGTLTVSDEGKGAEFAWRIKPSSPMIDALALPHVLSIRISDPATMSDKKVQGGSLPRRRMVGKPGRTVEVEGWSDDQSEIDALDALRDGLHHTFYPQSGDSFGVLVTGFEPDTKVDEYKRRTYRLSLAEAN